MFHADGPVWERRARQTWCEVVVARSRSMRMIVWEDAVCWHSLSERLVLCLADYSAIDHSVLWALLLTQRWGGIFQKWGGHGHIGPPQTKSQGAQAPLAHPVPTPMMIWSVACHVRDSSLLHSSNISMTCSMLEMTPYRYKSAISNAPIIPINSYNTSKLFDSIIKTYDWKIYKSEKTETDRQPTDHVLTAWPFLTFWTEVHRVHSIFAPVSILLSYRLSARFTYVGSIFDRTVWSELVNPSCRSEYRRILRKLKNRQTDRQTDSRNLSLYARAPFTTYLSCAKNLRARFTQDKILRLPWDIL